MTLPSHWHVLAAMLSLLDFYLKDRRILSTGTRKVGNSFKNYVSERIRLQSYHLHVVFVAGFTPLILAATAGHADVVEILLEHGADIEAQSERTKDTPLSLACSGGRYEVHFS